MEEWLWPSEERQGVRTDLRGLELKNPKRQATHGGPHTHLKGEVLPTWSGLRSPKRTPCPALLHPLVPQNPPEHFFLKFNAT